MSEAETSKPERSYRRIWILSAIIDIVALALGTKAYVFAQSGWHHG